MIKEVKENMDKFLNLADYLNEQAHITEQMELDISLSEAIKAEFVRFLGYLSASDGQITNEEVDFITEYLGFPLSKTALFTLVEENDIYSEEFESNVPIILKTLVEVDNYVFREGAELEKSISELMVDMYKMLGVEFAKADGDFNDQEEKDLRIYLRTLTTYLDENLIKNREPLKIGIKKTKKDTGVKAPAKGNDVKAPKKG